MESKREAILQAALELFADRGFHGTAVPLVAERAGVGAGTLYRYFESKEALVNALYQRWKSRFGEVLLERFPVDAAPRAQFHEFWQRMVRFAVENPRAALFLELHHHQPYIDAESRAIEERMLLALRAFITRAQEQQILKRFDPALLLAVAYGAFTGLMKEYWLGRVDLTPESIAQAETCAWESIRA